MTYPPTSPIPQPRIHEAHSDDEDCPDGTCPTNTRGLIGSLVAALASIAAVFGIVIEQTMQADITAAALLATQQAAEIADAAATQDWLRMAIGICALAGTIGSALAYYGLIKARQQEASK